MQRKVRMLIKENYHQINHFIVFKGAMNYHKNIFSASHGIAYIKYTNTQLKPVEL